MNKISKSPKEKILFGFVSLVLFYLQLSMVAIIQVKNDGYKYVNTTIFTKLLVGQIWTSNYSLLLSGT